MLLDNSISSDYIFIPYCIKMGSKWEGKASRKYQDLRNREMNVYCGFCVQDFTAPQLTTIAGFGSLALTDYGALASIGWATNFGIAATTLFTLWTFPAFMHFFRKKMDRVV